MSTSSLNEMQLSYIFVLLYISNVFFDIVILKIVSTPVMLCDMNNDMP